jgi:anti-anti-sigma regulatory factor
MSVFETVVTVDERDLCAPAAGDALSSWCRLAGQVQGRLSLSLARVQCLDVLGLSALTRLQIHCRKLGGELQLVEVSPRLEKRLVELGLSRVFRTSRGKKIRPTWLESLPSLSRAA